MKQYFPFIVLLHFLLNLPALSVSNPLYNCNRNCFLLGSFIQSDTFTTRWEVDKGHSSIMFSLTHLGIAEVNGFFSEFDGVMESSKPDFTDATITCTVDVNSVNTNNESRDMHLKSNDFFNAAVYPEMKFESKSFKSAGGNAYNLTGHLTIRDITRVVTFDVVQKGYIRAGGVDIVAFQAEGSINRLKYDLQWGGKSEDGILIAGTEIKILINFELKKVM